MALYAPYLPPIDWRLCDESNGVPFVAAIGWVGPMLAFQSTSHDKQSCVQKSAFFSLSFSTKYGCSGEAREWVQSHRGIALVLPRHQYDNNNTRYKKLNWSSEYFMFCPKDLSLTTSETHSETDPLTHVHDPGIQHGSPGSLTYFFTWRHGSLVRRLPVLPHHLCDHGLNLPLAHKL